MNSMKRSLSFCSHNFRTLNCRAALAVAAITLSLAVCAQAQTFTNLAAFNGNNGEYPNYGSLIQATNGD